MKAWNCTLGAMDFPGSARVSRAGDGVLAIADFSFGVPHALRDSHITEVRFGETPKPARETRALPNPLS
jgi:hypothetical protein